MVYGEQTTGTRDTQYNLESVLYHVLHGAENCDQYAADAEASGDERLAAFFRETQATQIQAAEQAKRLLGILEPPPEFGVTPDAISNRAQPLSEQRPLREEPLPGEVRYGRQGTRTTTPRGRPPYMH